jgi:hypothetical protein
MGRVENANQYSSYFVLNNMHMIPGAIGFFLGALFCSSLSSLASCLNSLTLVIWVSYIMPILTYHFVLFNLKKRTFFYFSTGRFPYKNEILSAIYAQIKAQHQ